ncbi:hypothetical protein ADUPG1_008739 [Aduncisulcus paluster]|uniref:Transmembrane protein n=1 Tax=Aduncisulcus paluster TaxID=2918883 RepID=A0ABQ5KT18_9EUKA|nr:hypothetical protein ADUPG1_008739 [Aduncisulcus paluster]
MKSCLHNMKRRIPETERETVQEDKLVRSPVKRAHYGKDEEDEYESEHEARSNEESPKIIEDELEKEESAQIASEEKVSEGPFHLEEKVEDFVISPQEEVSRSDDEKSSEDEYGKDIQGHELEVEEMPRVITSAEMDTKLPVGVKFTKIVFKIKHRLIPLILLSLGILFITYSTLFILSVKSEKFAAFISDRMQKPIDDGRFDVFGDDDSVSMILEEVFSHNPSPADIDESILAISCASNILFPFNFPICPAFRDLFVLDEEMLEMCGVTCSGALLACDSNGHEVSAVKKEDELFQLLAVHAKVMKMKGLQKEMTRLMNSRLEFVQSLFEDKSIIIQAPFEYFLKQKGRNLSEITLDEYLNLLRVEAEVREHTKGCGCEFVKLCQ